MSPMRQAVLVALLVAFALLLTLCTGSTPDDAELADGVERASAEGPDAAMQVDAGVADATDGAARADAATLEGSADTAARGPGPVTFHVVDRGGRPLPGVPLVLTRRRAGAPPEGVLAPTGPDGSAVVPDVLLGRDEVQLMVAIDPLKSGMSDAGGTPVTVVDANPMTLRHALARPARYHFVDAETGLALDVQRATAYDDLRKRDVSDDETRTLTVYDTEDTAGYSAFRTQVAPPEGYVYWDAQLWSQPLSAYAHDLDVVVPLRRAVDVRLTVLAHDGAPAAEAVVYAFRIGSTSKRRPATLRDGFGTLHVQGVPFFRREAITFHVGIPGTTAERRLRLRMGVDPSEPLVGTVQLPEPMPALGPGAEGGGSIGLGGHGSGAYFRGRFAGERGRAEVRVLRHDGSPAVGATVRVERRSAVTDEDGVARLANIPVGEHPVLVEQRGLLPITDTITIARGRVTRRALREGPGATVRLEVVDDRGEPLPYARFAATVPGERVQYIDEHEGVQRVDRYVDHDGRRTLERLDPRTRTVRVHWASRSTTVEVELRHGQRLPVRVVLPAPGR